VTAARSKSSKWSAGRVLSGPVSIVYIGFGGTTGYFGRLQATKRMRRIETELVHSRDRASIQLHLPKKLLKARIASQRIETRFHA
jgi:hypothetical protein